MSNDTFDTNTLHQAIGPYQFYKLDEDKQRKLYPLTYAPGNSNPLAYRIEGPKATYYAIRTVDDPATLYLIDCYYTHRRIRGHHWLTEDKTGYLHFS